MNALALAYSLLQIGVMAFFVFATYRSTREKNWIATVICCLFVAASVAWPLKLNLKPET